LRPEGWLRIAVAAVNVILVIALARALAGLTLAMLVGPSLPPAGSLAPVGSTPGSESPTLSGRVDDAAISSWHLFGRLEAERSVETPPAPAPVTPLNLRLVGIFFMERGSDRALALIADGGGPERGFRIGEPLPGGARLQRIQRDHVIISRGGQEEVLHLPKLGEVASRPAPLNTLPDMSPAMPSDLSPGMPEPEGASDMPPDMPEPEGEPAASGESSVIDASAVAERLRGGAMTGPRALEDIAFASPYVQNGQFVGFRLRQGRDRILWGQLGLNSGDVVTEVNGNRLNSPAQGLTLLKEVLSADRVSLRVLRNGAEIPLTFSLSGRAPR
jgi:general secretion pathway protein C